MRPYEDDNSTPKDVAIRLMQSLQQAIRKIDPKSIADWIDADQKTKSAYIERMESYFAAQSFVKRKLIEQGAKHVSVQGKRLEQTSPDHFTLTVALKSPVGVASHVITCWKERGRWWVSEESLPDLETLLV